jgi:thiamine-phosphate pyrophosphorylase
MSGPGADRVGRLHVLTDETQQGRFSHLELARLAALGGADVVQLREKRPRPTAELVRLARAMAELLGAWGAGLIVNDRADVAVAAMARGVHLGRGDLAPRRAREILGPDAVIGATANCLDQALLAAAGPVDYLGVGPVFSTRSKDRPAPILGLDGLAVIARAVEVPVVAIGGITPERVQEVIAAGAHGVAVLSAVVGDPDPVRATRRMREALCACIGACAP